MSLTLISLRKPTHSLPGLTLEEVMRLPKVDAAAIDRAQSVIEAGQPWNATVKELQQWLRHKTGRSWNGITKEACLRGVNCVILS